MTHLTSLLGQIMHILLQREFNWSSPPRGSSPTQINPRPNTQYPNVIWPSLPAPLPNCRPPPGLILLVHNTLTPPTPHPKFPDSYILHTFFRVSLSESAWPFLLHICPESQIYCQTPCLDQCTLCTPASILCPLNPYPIPMPGMIPSLLFCPNLLCPYQTKN